MQLPSQLLCAVLIGTLVVPGFVLARSDLWVHPRDETFESARHYRDADGNLYYPEENDLGGKVHIRVDADGEIGMRSAVDRTVAPAGAEAIGNRTRSASVSALAVPGRPTSTRSNAAPSNDRSRGCNGGRIVWVPLDFCRRPPTVSTEPLPLWKVAEQIWK